MNSRGHLLFSCLFLASCFLISAPLAVEAAETKKKDNTATPAAAKLDKGITAFKDLCLGTAPNFSKAEAKAAAYGLEPMPVKIPGLNLLTAKDNSLTLQIDTKECSVTTPKKNTAENHKAFIALVAEATGDPRVKTFTKTPFVAKYKGKTYIFHHDPKGGEAYVMLLK